MAVAGLRGLDGLFLVSVRRGAVLHNPRSDLRREWYWQPQVFSDRIARMRDVWQKWMLEQVMATLHVPEDPDYEMDGEYAGLSERGLKFEEDDDPFDGAAPPPAAVFCCDVVVRKGERFPDKPGTATLRTQSHVSSMVPMSLNSLKPTPVKVVRHWRKMRSIHFKLPWLRARAPVPHTKKSARSPSH